MSRYHSIGNLGDDALDVAVDMDGNDVRLSVDYTDGEARIQPDVARALADALLAAADECERRRT